MKHLPIPKPDQVAAFEQAGLVTVRPHNTLPLRIVNYTPAAQFQRAWTPELRTCRGLVFDREWNLAARPFPKFFNYEEHLGDNPPAGPLPTGPFVATEKMDGSLGIVFKWRDHLEVATRGSFHSVQAEKARGLIARRWDRHFVDTLMPGATHLFEIIYPENRIVVNYGDVEDLVWLASIRNEDGADLDEFGLLFGQLARIEGTDARALKQAVRPNAEGYVLRYENGERVKVKYDEYVRLHAMVTGLDTVRLWEVLREGKDPLQELTSLPDELYGWAENEVKELVRKHGDLAYHAISQVDFIKQHLPDGWTRKDFAARALQYPYKPLYFLALDGNNEALEEAVWKIIKPERRKPTLDDAC